MIPFGLANVVLSSWVWVEMTALRTVARGGVERGYGTSKEGTDVWEVDSLRERGTYSNFIADPT